MPSITREQAEKWNASALNGFSFDVRNFAIWGEKRLHKWMELEDGRAVEIVLDWRDEYETRTNANGCKWNVRTGRVIPEMHVTVWRPTGTEGVYSSGGPSKREDIGEPQKRKNYGFLCKLSGEVNADQIVSGALAA